MRTNKQVTLQSKEVTLADSYILLPECQEISTYVKQKFKEDDLAQEYYFMPHNKKNVFMILSLVLGGPNIPTKLKQLLQQENKVREWPMKELKQKMENKFEWDTPQRPIDTFFNNMNKLQEVPIVYFLSQQLFPKVSDEVAQKLFIYACQGDYLYGVKIRWQTVVKNKMRKEFQRHDEKKEWDGRTGNIYLVIFEYDRKFKVGIIRTKSSYQTLSTVMNDDPNKRNTRDIHSEDEEKQISCCCQVM